MGRDFKIITRKVCTRILRLTCYRTDNSVKNHWNSLVRRKQKGSDSSNTSDDDEPEPKRIKIEDSNEGSDLDVLRSTSPPLAPGYEPMTKIPTTRPLPPPTLFQFAPQPDPKVTTAATSQVIVRPSVIMPKTIIKQK